MDQRGRIHNDVKLQTVPYVKAAESVELKITGFNLSDLLAGYNGEDDTLWPLGLKVDVMNHQMSRVALGQATLKIIPAYGRLPRKVRRIR